MVNKKTIFITFLYIFLILKKGIFVCIKDNKLKTFLPFSNANYRNDWGRNLKFRGPKFNIKSKDMDWNRNLNEWYANYCIFRNEIHKSGPLKGLSFEGSIGVEEYYDFFRELCNKRKLNDSCFFLNTRDFPILKRDFTHPYPLLYSKVPKYEDIKVPILSQSVSDEYADISFPTVPDIQKIGKIKLHKEVLWENKKTVAIFRGSATGCGTHENSNPRLMLLKVSKTIEPKNLVDIGLTSYNRRIKLDPVRKYCETIKNGPISNFIKNFWSYKYIIHIPGFVEAFRLTEEFSYNSLLIKFNNQWKIWYSDILIGYDPIISRVIYDDRIYRVEPTVLDSHYIVLGNIPDLQKVLNWCLKNDNVVQTIVKNGSNLFENFLGNREFMLSYCSNIISNIGKKKITP